MIERRIFAFLAAIVSIAIAATTGEPARSIDVGRLGIHSEPQVGTIQQTPRSQNLKFSHRFHLTKTDAVCEDCHAAADASSASGDNLLPLEKDCLTCHNGVKAGKDCTVCHAEPAKAKHFDNSIRDFRFSHRQHLKLGNVAAVLAAAIDQGKYLTKPGNIRRHLNTDDACAACHRGLEETDFAKKENLPQMADCLVCHPKIDPPFSCEFCHTKGAQIKPASHTPDYFDLHSSKQYRFDKQSCVICHAVKFTCLGCH
jgi:hypothetical protein